MWLLAEMDPGEPTYNITWALWLDGALEVSALQQAWDAALARHEALRTTFRNESGVPVQVIEDEPAARPLLVTSVEQLGRGRAGARRPAPDPRASPGSPSIWPPGRSPAPPWCGCRRKLMCSRW